jgi:hypothetical protein
MVPADIPSSTEKGGHAASEEQDGARLVAQHLLRMMGMGMVLLLRMLLLLLLHVLLRVAYR